MKSTEIKDWGKVPEYRRIAGTGSHGRIVKKIGLRKG
jgi:hypothetical protein